MLFVYGPLKFQRVTRHTS